MSLSQLPPKAGHLQAIDLLVPKIQCPRIVRYGFRSFNRQWLIADARLLDRPSPGLWQAHSDNQVYMTSLITNVLGEGPRKQSRQLSFPILTTSVDLLAPSMSFLYGGTLGLKMRTLRRGPSTSCRAPTVGPVAPEEEHLLRLLLRYPRHPALRAAVLGGANHPRASHPNHQRCGPCQSSRRGGQAPVVASRTYGERFVPPGERPARCRRAAPGAGLARRPGQTSTLRSSLTMPRIGSFT